MGGRLFSVKVLRSSKFLARGQSGEPITCPAKSANVPEQVGCLTSGTPRSQRQPFCAHILRESSWPTILPRILALLVTVKGEDCWSFEIAHAVVLSCSCLLGQLLA